ncbi:MAG: hypothetical protein HGA62_02255 [Chlorobiaceae bacterium]|nr:hypothetical protein [Chlorobiaceae bacterium]NTV61563.1 hypothetical protein [Chlorobiaceae bacterium]
MVCRSIAAVLGLPENDIVKRCNYFTVDMMLQSHQRILVPGETLYSELHIEQAGGIDFFIASG